MSFVEFFLIILGFAAYPILNNRHAFQRQDAYLLLGVALLGFAVFTTPQIPSQPGHHTLHLGQIVAMVVAYCSVMCSFLLRRKSLHARQIAGLNTQAWGPLILGLLGLGTLGCLCIAIFARVPVWGTGLAAGFILQVLGLLWALLHPHKQHPHLFYKSLFFVMLFALCQASILLGAIFNTTATSIFADFASIGQILYLVLLGCALGQTLFQEFTQKRGRSWRNIQTTDAIAMELAYRSRRVLKDFRHDLRQPLSTLGILASVGKAIAKEPEVSARYQHIQTAQRALKTMLEDFFTQLDNTIRHPHSTNNSETLCEIHIHSILDPLVAEYRLLAQNKGIELRYVPSTAMAYTNAEAIAKIVRNGLDNAIKYTDHGGVVVGIRRHGQQHIGIQIVDTGPGIDTDKVANHHKGWGHGATMVQELSERIFAKPSMTTRSKGNTIYGSVFELLLPQTQSACLGVGHAQAAAQQGLHARVLAFNPDSLEEAQMLFPTSSFDHVGFTISGAYRCYLNSLRTGISPVYIGYAHSASEHKQARNTLLLLNALLDFSPCCILMYPCNEPEKQHVHFNRSVIEIPFRSGDPASGFRLLEELFPMRHKNSPEGADSPDLGRVQIASSSSLAA